MTTRLELINLLKCELDVALENIESWPMRLVILKEIPKSFSNAL